MSKPKILFSSKKFHVQVEYWEKEKFKEGKKSSFSMNRESRFENRESRCRKQPRKTEKFSVGTGADKLYSARNDFK